MTTRWQASKARHNLRRNRPFRSAVSRQPQETADATLSFAGRRADCVTEQASAAV